MIDSPPLDDLVFLEAVQGLLNLYRGFPWESQVWARYGPRRSPYRALVLFGLSPRTRDHLLVDMCRRFFTRFPDTDSLVAAWPAQAEAVKSIVREGQLPFVQSAAGVIRRSDGAVPSDVASLLEIRGVGEKVAECVLAYGWGQEALPVDGHVCRVVVRLYGFAHQKRRDYASCVRRRLKGMFAHRRGWMAARGIAMVDIHELFRLHGQVVCAETPRCARCPLACCASRQQEYVRSHEPLVTPLFWQEWRELLLEPAGVETPGRPAW